ncbi:MAG: rhodanese-like domain-containing protein [Candidatus Kapabacteria bacterium]|nr:rhodanese-like domain-containing protein [Candidatus Kapabacteria bacterium]
MLNFLKNMMGGGNEDVVNAIRSGAVIIDVRSPAEFSGGHVAGSKNIPLNELPGKLSSLPSSKPIVFCCASGARSGSATGIATSKGYTAFNGGPWTSVNRVMADISENK